MLAGVVVTELGGQGEAEQRVVVGPRHFLQRLVAFAVHAAEVLDHALHLRPGGGVEAALAGRFDDGVVGTHGLALQEFDEVGGALEFDDDGQGQGRHGKGTGVSEQPIVMDIVFIILGIEQFDR